MRRRNTEVFSLSFLDCMCCGFGALVLFYTVISAQSGVERVRKQEDLTAEASRLEEQVLDGYKNLVVLRNAVEQTSTDTTRTSGRLMQILEELERTRVEMARYSGDNLSRREHINKLKADIRSLEEGTQRLNAGAKEQGQEGDRVRAFRQGGDRQYLTGIKLNGKRILILVDASASMLDETLVNILRMRNLHEVEKILAPKWQRTVSTVDWLAAQLPADSQFQIYAFNTQARSVVEGSDGKWVAANQARALDSAIQTLRRTAPKDGTSLANAFQVARTLSPAPDQIVLITDGLPTQGPTAPAIRKAVDADQRAKLFDQAIEALPPKVPVTTILMPMEGDLPAPSRYWRLARATGGVFMMPARDWP